MFLLQLSKGELSLKRQASPNQYSKTAGTAVLAALLVCIAIPMTLAAQASPKTGTTKSALSGTQGASSGKELFQQHCASCHYAETTAQKIGPGLKGLAARGTFANGQKVTDAGLTKWVEDGGKNMPGLKDSVKPDQISTLISYVKTL